MLGLAATLMLGGGLTRLTATSPWAGLTATTPWAGSDFPGLSTSYLDPAAMRRLTSKSHKVDWSSVSSAAASLGITCTSLGMTDVSRPAPCSAPRPPEGLGHVRALVKQAAGDRFTLPMFDLDRPALRSWDGSCIAGSHARGEAATSASELRRRISHLEQHGYLPIDNWGLDLAALRAEVEAALRLANPEGTPKPRVVSSAPLPSLAPLLSDRSIANLLRGYLGGEVRYDGHVALRLSDGLTPANYVSAEFHHDRCGRRLKAFIFLHDVHPDGRPTLVAEGSHRMTYYRFGEPYRVHSRLSPTYVHNRYDVRPMTGGAGGGFLFDTNAIHRGMHEGNASRTAVVLEFHSHGKLGWLQSQGFGGRCPSVWAVDAAAIARGRPGWPLYPPENVTINKWAMRKAGQPLLVPSATSPRSKVRASGTEKAGAGATRRSLAQGSKPHGRRPPHHHHHEESSAGRQLRSKPPNGGRDQAAAGGGTGASATKHRGGGGGVPLSAKPSVRLSDASMAAILANETAHVAWQSSKAREKPELIAKLDLNVERDIGRRHRALRLHGKAVLCIGARGGGEVRAFRSLGALAIGIDLYPLPGSDLVLHGTATRLQFAPAVFDMIYTNVVDHIPSLRQWAAEVERVLKPQGGFLLADVFLQLRSQDDWAVRDTGTPEFYDELRAAFAATGAMVHCWTRPTDRRFGNDWIAMQRERAAALAANRPQGEGLKIGGGPGGRDQVVFARVGDGVDGAAACQALRAQLQVK